MKLNLARYLIKAGQCAEAREQLLALSRLGDSLPARAEVAELLKALRRLGARPDATGSR